MRSYGLPRNHAPCFNTTKGLGLEDASHVCRTDIQGQAMGESFKDEEHRKRGLAFLDQADDAILRFLPRSAVATEDSPKLTFLGRRNALSSRESS